MREGAMIALNIIGAFAIGFMVACIMLREVPP